MRMRLSTGLAALRPTRPHPSGEIAFSSVSASKRGIRNDLIGIAVSFFCEKQHAFQPLLRKYVAMLSGIYHVHFSGGPSQNFGEGIAVFNDGKINGGDVGYVYRGSYQSTEKRMAATINVKRWNPAVPNPLANIPEYDLVVEAPSPDDWNNFSVSATAAQIPQLSVSITCRRLAEVA